MSLPVLFEEEKVRAAGHDLALVLGHPLALRKDLKMPRNMFGLPQEFLRERGRKALPLQGHHARDVPRLSVPNEDAGARH